MRRLSTRVVSVIALLGVSACGSVDRDQNSNSGPRSVEPTSALTSLASTTTVVVVKSLLQSLPIDIAQIDWALVMQHSDLYTGGTPIADFGFLDGEGTENERRNPQPTFHVPLGTPVLAPIDGMVSEVKMLYSGDYTIMFVGSSGDRSIAWETEHVEAVLVNPGDVVRAGQPVASVSNYLCTYSKKQFGNDSYCGLGIGLVELGYLVGGAVPRHYCPFGALTDPTAIGRIESELSNARSAIEQLAGKRLFDTENWATPNCIIDEPIEG